MKSLLRSYPPYEGAEPYVYFAFAPADARRAGTLLRLLFSRGFRVWYCLGPAGSAEELLRRQSRAGNAALTMVYLSDDAASEKDLKSAVLVNQREARAILCLDPDGSDRRLAMGLREDVPHLGLYEFRGRAALEAALIRAEGVTQELVGEPVRTGQGSLAVRLAAVFTLLAAAMLLLSFFGARFFGQDRVPEDTVVFDDPVVRAAVSQAVGGRALTEDRVASVALLRFSSLPESWDDLALLPALETLELSQRAVMAAETLPEGYRIVLSGGETS